MSQVRLIAFTQPIELEGVQTGEELVAYCARVSNPANQANHETAPRLLNYLVRNQHWSPFEMAHAVIEIKTTRDIARQILRHRSFSFQEFSQRYAEVVADPVLREARLQDTTNRQNSTESQDSVLRTWWDDQQAWLAEQAVKVYQDALNQGIAKEVARAVLPEGLTPSRLYMSGSVRSWIHYIQLRAGNGTQKEHREIAVMCKLALLHVMPSIKEVLDAS
ncbi:THY1 Predicted alternative thymidylate synthase [uncultured Caudovirales phage]|uniref:THY1 Predicted alternative thymidylate synthase n=1 Tax=uncultured Caudovirales phage TaxID=2100421 RepID=A0A6J5RSS9_9CAUD|nr:THY1 Predicted alternative thymidylate synthase [uncultured Caudovirales phage]CAB4200375.1 THY1 Predicted alternative thymidylate synthase [uncultured Caudovirales phage]